MNDIIAEPKVLGVIPARGGSKRLHRKNIKLLNGKPMLAYTIEAAHAATTLTHFVVTSEDREIIKVAREYGAPTPFVRPMELAGDKVRNIETVKHAMEFMEKENNLVYDILVLLQPTCPIRSALHIDMAVQKLWSSSQQSAVSVKGPYKKRDPILKKMNHGVIEPYCDGLPFEHNEPFYLYNASIYAVKREYFVKEKKLISEKQVPIVMDDLHSTDVDTEEDFLVAELFLKYLQKDDRKEYIK